MTAAEAYGLDEYKALLRADFASFAVHCFHELNPRTEFALSWHHEFIAAKLEAAREGRIRRLIINVPPRHLKSHLASAAFPAWCLGHEPGLRIVCASYAQDLADKIVARLPTYPRQRLVPAALRDPPFGATASRVRVRDHGAGLSARHLGRRRADRTGCRHHHHRRSVETRGGLVASPAAGGQRLVRPYPLQPTERHPDGCDHPDHAPAAREPALGLDPRDDLAGHVLAQEDWEVVRLAAIAEDDESYALDAELGSRSLTRQRGEALHPDRQPLPTLEQIRRTLGEYNFAGQYQQMPSPQGGGMVKAAWFRSYAPNEQPDKFDRIVQSWDTANKASELSDFSVCTTSSPAGPRPADR